MKDSASVSGGYLLHSYEARTLAARSANVHALAIGMRFDQRRFACTVSSLLLALRAHDAQIAA